MKEAVQRLGPPNGPTGLAIPEILLPRGVDLHQWAVIACDQFTQDRAYWERVQNAAAGSPSTLHLIFPEVFLSEGDSPRRIGEIHRAMESYLSDGVFAPPRRGCVYIERNTPFQQQRRGLIIAVDLEHYDWRPGARSLIRSTEGTVPERLPPRMDIRRGAPLETPHILLLIDDDADSLLPALGEQARKDPPVYQTELMMRSGSVSGWFIDNESELDYIAAHCAELARRSVTRYGADGTAATDGAEPFLCAVGDGNHSLATAKGIWDEYKKTTGALPDHPCRYALVEIENIYDPAITFEPIHRVMFGINFDKTLTLLAALPGFSIRLQEDREELVRLVGESAATNNYGLVSGNRYALIETSTSGIATAALQPLLDRRLETAAKRGDPFSVDYIHGAEELFRLASAPDCRTAGILLPPVQKAGLFETVARTGPLPRKSFSMGEASEKRFYLECRRLG
jgi:hypothetical protein